MIIDIPHILTKGESDVIEFKTSFNEDVIESLVAFANTKGGAVFIGITDNAEVKGVMVETETLQKWTNEIRTKTQPGLVPIISVIEFHGKHIVRLFINEFPVKPVSCKGRFFKRLANSNYQLSALEISNLSMQSLQVSWDSYPAYNKSLDSIDFEKVQNL